MHWILQQFCEGDEDMDSDDAEEPQKVAPKPAVAKPAAAEAAESVGRRTVAEDASCCCSVVISQDFI